MGVIKEALLEHLDKYAVLFDERQIEQLVKCIANKLESLSGDINQQRNRTLVSEILEDELNSFISNDLLGDRRIMITYFQKMWGLEKYWYLAVQNLITFFSDFGFEPDIDYYLILLKEYPCLLSTFDNVFTSISLPIAYENLEQIPHYSDISQVVAAYMSYRNISIELNLGSFNETIKENSHCSTDYFCGEPMTVYINEAIKYPVLTCDEEKEYLIRIAQGDSVARDYFISCNLRLVIYFAKKFQGRGLEILDLIQEGNIGLMRAVDGFDISKGVRFSTYASDWIRQAIERAIDDKGSTIRNPVHIEEKLKKIRKAQQELSAKLERDATIGEIAEKLGWSATRVQKIYGMKVDLVSLQEPVNESDSASELGNFIADQNDCYEDIGMPNKRSLMLYAMRLAGLNKKEQFILMCRKGFYNGKRYNLEEVGNMIGGMSRQCVNFDEIAAIKKLQHPCIIRLLANYIGTEPNTEIFNGLYPIQRRYLKEISDHDENTSNQERLFDKFESSNSEDKKRILELIIEIMSLAGLRETEKKLLLYRDGFYDGKKYSLPDIGKLMKRSLKDVSSLEIEANNKLKNLYSIYCEGMNYVEQVINLHPDRISIYDYFMEYSKDQVDRAIMKLTLQELELVKRKYGEDYQSGKKDALNSVDAGKFAKTVLPKIKKLLSQERQRDNDILTAYPTLESEDYKNFKKYIEGDEFKDAIRSLRLEDSIIAVLSLLCVNGKRMPLSLIGELCGIEDDGELGEAINAGIAKLNERFGVNVVESGIPNIQNVIVLQSA